MYERILVVTSDQRWVDPAVAYAIALAANTGAALSILTVLMPPIAAGMPDVTACSSMVLESVARQSQAILGCAAAAAAQAGVSCHTQLRWGNVPATILSSAAAHDCDLIILGARQNTWRPHQWQDYTTRQVTKHARQPVLLVSQAPAALTYGAPLWSSLLVVRDHSRDGEAAEDYAYGLAEETGTEVAVLHIDTLLEGLETGYLSTLAMLDQPCHWPLAATERLDEALSAARQVSSTLVETVTDTACDVILLGVQQDTGWKRWLRRQPSRLVLAATSQPVLLLNQ